VPENNPVNTTFRFAEFELIPHDRLLMRSGERVALTPRMFGVLLKLVEAGGHVVTKDELLRDVWSDAAVEEGNLNRTVSALRKELGERRGENRFIQTIPKSGYRFVADVSIANGHRPVSNGIGIAVTPGSSKFKAGFAIAAFVVIFVGLIAAFYFLPRTATTSLAKPDEPTGLVRLTNNNFDEDAAEWTFDNKIRFIRYVTNTRAESWIMNSDGSDQHRANDQIKNLQTGQWSPDGNKVVFVKENEGRRNVYLANADGSNEKKLPLNYPPTDWSPDGTSFVYSANVGGSNYDIFIYDIASEKSTNISNSPAFDADPLFSPDGTMIAFASDRDGNSENYVMNVDGSNVRRVTFHPAVDAFPVISPDGTQLIFDSNRDEENTDIYIRNLNDDRPLIKLTDLPSNEEHRSNCWSPDGTKIVITSDQSGKSNIYVFNVESSKPQLFISDENADLQYPAFSGDGKTLVYQARSADRSLELRASFSDGTRPQTIFRTEPVAANLAMIPAISNDSNRIAFTNRIDRNSEICVINTDGSGIANLTQNAAADANATFSTDGREIYFQSNRDGAYERFHIFKMNSDGSEQRRLLTREGYEFNPRPVGTQVIFSGDRVDANSRALDIRIADVANPENEHVIAQRSFHDTQPSVSPDGNWVAFVAQSDGNSEIYLCKIDGSGLVRLTRNAGEDMSPAFSADGKYLFFSSDRGGRFAIYRIDLNL
jgi:TolB protein